MWNSQTAIRPNQRVGCRKEVDCKVGLGKNQSSMDYDNGNQVIYKNCTGNSNVNFNKRHGEELGSLQTHHWPFLTIVWRLSTFPHLHWLLGGWRRLPEIAHVHPGTENADELVFVAVDIPFHDVHARTHQTLECLHVQNWNKTQSDINQVIVSRSFIFTKLKSIGYYSIPVNDISKVSFHSLFKNAVWCIYSSFWVMVEMEDLLLPFVNTSGISSELL